MYLSNLPGVVGVALAIGAGYWLDNRVPRNVPGLESLAIHLSALLLGLYGLTLDRCEVPGLFASYRENVRGMVDGLGIAFGESPVGVERTRRLCVFVIPVAFAPLLNMLLWQLGLVFTWGLEGSVTRAQVQNALTLPIVVVGVCAGYARATERLRLRPAGGYGGTSFSN